MANGLMNTPFSPVMDEEERRRMQMQYLQSQQEPMPQRVNVGAYLDDMSAIQANRNKWSARARMFGGSVQFPSVGGDVKERAGIRDEMIQDEILNRQRAAILGGEISNIDEQMQWYQTNGFDPHFAKEARTAAQSIFDQRFQEAGQVRAVAGEERAVAGEERAVLGEARAVDTAARAQENLEINIAKERRAAATNARQSTDRSRADVRTTREDSILEWMVREYETRSAVAGADPVAIWDDVKSEGMGHARDKGFIGFEMVAGEYIPRESEDPSYTAKQTTGINLDEKRIFDEFKNEIPRPSVKDDKDEDFVSVPARTYSDQYEEDWRTAADDFETASNLAETINAAIRADDTIAPENKQAVFEKVLKNLESVEKGVGRPTPAADPAALRSQQMFESMVQVAPFPVGGELSTPENIMEAQTGFLRAVQMRERTERASSEFLAQLQDPLMKSRIYAELTGMKEMNPASRGIASEFDPVLVSMRNAISEIDKRLADRKTSDVDKMNLRKVREQQLRKYADHWGVTLDYADWRHNPKAYRDRKVNF